MIVGNKTRKERMEMVNGISKDVQKAVREGKIELVYPPKTGNDFAFKTYKSRTWAIKGIKQLRDKGYVVSFVRGFGDMVQIWFKIDWTGNPTQYYQVSTSTGAYVYRPLAKIESAHKTLL